MATRTTRMDVRPRELGTHVSMVKVSKKYESIHENGTHSAPGAIFWFDEHPSDQEGSAMTLIRVSLFSRVLVDRLPLLEERMHSIGCVYGILSN